MYNSDLPNRADLPTPRQLRRSTIMAATIAAGLLVTTILPAEYAVDPTGVGRLLGLTQMGEIKQQLALEASQDAGLQGSQTTALGEISKKLDQINRKLDGEPAAEPAAAEAETTAEPTAEQLASADAPAADAAVVEKSDVMEITLEPNQGAEVKLEMREGAEIAFRWAIEGGVVNYDTHGDPYEKPKDFYHGYGKGKGSAGEEGRLQAAFDGLHGWYWRNRSDAPVTLTLETSGKYFQIKRIS